MHAADGRWHHDGAEEVKFSFLLVCMVACCQAGDWPMFRGPNGTGVALDADAAGLPSEFGPSRNLVWKTVLPPGHSSPVLFAGKIYLTGIENDRLYTICLKQSDGTMLWKREAPRPRKDAFDKRNNPASPSPAADASGIYVFFPEFGLLSYTHDGKERWRHPLGPFDNSYGMGASPLIAGNGIVLVCDQNQDSFAMAVRASDGKLQWKQPRKDAVSGHSTPVLYRPKSGPLQVIAPGSFRMDSYQATTGEVLWYANGLASEMKSVPVVDGDTVYINGFNLPENDPGRQIHVPPFEEMLPHDKNKNRLLEKDELPEGRAKAFFQYFDLNKDAAMNESEWRAFQQSMAAENGLLAIGADGRGDVTASHTRWKFQRSIPQLPSTVLYRGVLYMVNDGGILTTLDPQTGKAHQQGRLRGASDRIYSSPVAGDGKVFFVTQTGVVVVLKAGPAPETLATNDLGEDTYATPAIANGRIYIRTTQALYAFGVR